MDKDEFKKRTKSFAINIGKFCKTLPYDPVTKHYIAQIIRCSSSVGANYRAACRAKSKADFINKMRIVEEEGDESMFFLELIYEFHPEKKDEIKLLYKEANEILSMTISSINTALKSAEQSAISNLKSEIK
jgi:four helix bundle protein